jgi:hypothetical protein
MILYVCIYIMDIVLNMTKYIIIYIVYTYISNIYILYYVYIELGYAQLADLL